jgi:hypothetical protein
VGGGGCDVFSIILQVINNHHQPSPP